ncbi:MAG: flagellar biosynthetic protein FliO [Gammaproteobacteria bacterium]|nr:flagellar biosynthetic protein FliO [Gammaproteobacteria bacterium]MBU1441108.1 flagellar biosynthetic protein FliO [Gammaproteobacteria bacterium]MBU2286768.1 flagellar biosynthetic protein FliO [Gammaproteobacteria bacterium]MBU2409367.1 flagellar biosynthetic protein FliO [Gammaproteobacteria bacterium]
MIQSLVTVVLFIGLMLCIPFMLRKLQQRRGGMLGAATQGTSSRLVSAVAVGPQQRVVTVEVGPESARTWLVLGVTGQSITCLHALPASPAPLAPPGVLGVPAFAAPEASHV